MPFKNTYTTFDDVECGLVSIHNGFVLPLHLEKCEVFVEVCPLYFLDVVFTCPFRFSIKKSCYHQLVHIVIITRIFVTIFSVATLGTWYISQ